MSTRSLHALVATLALLTALTSCSEAPTSYDNLPNGAFAGVNTGLLSTLITHTTGIVGDTASAVVVAAEIGGSHLSGEAVASKRFRGFGVFDIDGAAGEVGGLSANLVPLRFVADAPPAHYEIDTTAASVLPAQRWVVWGARWSPGDSVTAGADLPPTFGNVTLSVGTQMSVAALDAGQDVTVQWSNVVPGQRVFIYASWRPAVFAPTLVVPPIPILVVADSGAVKIPGEHLANLVRQPDGRLSFVLYRGAYGYGATFANGRTLATFNYVSDSVRVELVE